MSAEVGQVLAQQIAFEANNINVLLGQLATTRRKRARQVLLRQAALAAQRALAQLQREPLVRATRNYVAESLARKDLNIWAAAEEIRQDRETIRWFVGAECDLLRACGFDKQLIDRLQQDMFDVLSDVPTDLPESLTERFEQMQARITENLGALEHNARRDSLYSDIAAVLGILGGCGIVAADTAAATGTVGALAPSARNLWPSRRGDRRPIHRRRV